MANKNKTNEMPSSYIKCLSQWFAFHENSEKKFNTYQKNKEIKRKYTDMLSIFGISFGIFTIALFLIRSNYIHWIAHWPRKKNSFLSKEGRNACKIPPKSYLKNYKSTIKFKLFPIFNLSVWPTTFHLVQLELIIFRLFFFKKNLQKNL